MSLPLNLQSANKLSGNLQSLSLHYKKLLADYEPIVDEARAQLHAVEVLLQGTKNSDVVQQEPLAEIAPSEHPLLKFAGIFADDPFFAEIAREIRAEREEPEDSETGTHRNDLLQIMNLWILDTDHTTFFLKGNPSVTNTAIPNSDYYKSRREARQ